MYATKPPDKWRAVVGIPPKGVVGHFFKVSASKPRPQSSLHARYGKKAMGETLRGRDTLLRG